MPVFLITPHAYRSWNADNPRGYVRLNQGILPPDPEQAKRYNRRTKHERVRFDQSLHELLIEGCRDLCNCRGWRLHQIVVVSSHLHALISWTDKSLCSENVRDTIKRILGWMLATHSQQPGRKWFARKGSRKPVHGREHFEHLMNCYLPDHANGRRGGSGWCEKKGYYGAAFEKR